MSQSTLRLAVAFVLAAVGVVTLVAFNLRIGIVPIVLAAVVFARAGPA